MRTCEAGLCQTRYTPRPSHADYTAEIKYLGYQDYRGGGHFSGRITAPLVAAGAIFLQMLKAKNIEVGTHVAQMQEIMDEPFAQEEAAAPSAEGFGRSISGLPQRLGAGSD